MPHSAQFCLSSSGPLICKRFWAYCGFGVTTDTMPNNLPDTSRTEEGNSQPLSNFLKSQQCFMPAKALNSSYSIPNENHHAAWYKIPETGVAWSSQAVGL